MRLCSHCSALTKPIAAREWQTLEDDGCIKCRVDYFLFFPSLFKQIAQYTCTSIDFWSFIAFSLSFSNFSCTVWSPSISHTSCNTINSIELWLRRYYAWLNPYVLVQCTGSCEYTRPGCAGFIYILKFTIARNYIECAIANYILSITYLLM